MRSPPVRLAIPAYPSLIALAALDAMGYSLIAPVLPEIARATGAGPAITGALVATFPLGIVLGFPMAGAVVRRRGTLPLLIGSLVLISGGSLGFVLGGDLAGYAAGRLLMGLGSGGLWIGITFATLERWPGQEYPCMSRILAAYSIGALLGPAIGSVGGIRGPFVAYLVVVLAALPLALLMGRPEVARPFGTDRSALRLPAFWFASAGIVFAVLALAVAEGVFPLHLGTRLGQASVGGAYVAMSLAVAAAASLAARVEPSAALLAASVLGAAGLGIVGVSDGPASWLIGLLTAGIGIGLANTGSIGVLLEAVSPDRIVTAMVVWSEVGILGYLLGPLAGGAVAERWGFGAVPLVVLPMAIPVAVAATASLLRRPLPPGAS